MSVSVIYDLLVIFATGLLANVVCKRLRVPVLIGYMLVGVVIGTDGLGLIGSKSHPVEQLAEAGVFLLLFAVGLEFSLDELLRLGRHLIVAGSVQMALVAGPVAGLLIGCGLPWRGAVLLAAAVAFSSTVLVFKTLAEWGQTASAAGRRAIGILLFQDIMLVPLLLVVPQLAGLATPSLLDGAALAGTSLTFVGSVFLFRAILAKWIIPSLASHHSPELIVLAAIVVLGSVTFAAHHIGLPPAVGALAAGLMLSGNRWTAQIDALVMPFRETFSLVFFVSLGLLLDSRVLSDQPLLLLGMLFALILLKGTVAMLALRLTGLSWPTSLATGIGLAHVGEFAFVLVPFALQFELLTEACAQQFVAIALASFMLSPLMLRAGSQKIEVATIEEKPPGQSLPLTKARFYSLVIGIGPIGRRIASYLETTGHDVCVIDRSPLNLHPFEQQGFHAVAGDAGDVETLARAHADHALWAVIAVSDDFDCLTIVRALRQFKPLISIIVRCRYQVNEPGLHHAGADHVVSEEFQSGEALVSLLSEKRNQMYSLNIPS